MGSSAIIYTKTEWINKQVALIPVPINITDRTIEKQKTNDEYTLQIPVREIKRATIKDGKGVGRITVPPKWIGLDVLIIEEPNYEELY